MQNAFSCLCDCANEQKISYFCQTQGCKLSRRCCCNCRDFHTDLNHVVIQLGKNKDQDFLNNGSSMDNRKSIIKKIENTSTRIDNVEKKLTQIFKHVLSQLEKCCLQLKKRLKWVYRSVENSLKAQTKNIIYKKESTNQDLEQIAQIFRYLRKEKASKAEDIFKTCDNIENVSIQLQNQYSKHIENLLMQFKSLDPIKNDWIQHRLKRMSSMQSFESQGGLKRMNSAQSIESDFEFKNYSIDLQNQSLMKFNKDRNPSKPQQTQMKQMNWRNVPQQQDHQNKIIKLSFENINLTQIMNLDSFLFLQKLNLSYNSITKIQCLDKLQFLKQLIADGNKIVVIENLDNLQKLQLLSLQSNQIEKIQNINHLYNLSILQLGGNKISVIQGFENCQQLEVMSLFSNKIQQITNFEQFPKLMHLYLTNNPLKYRFQIPTLINSFRDRNIDIDFDENDFFIEN